MRRLLLRARGLPDIEAAVEPGYVDDRLLGEPKSAQQKPPRLLWGELQRLILRLVAVLAGCYLLDLQELVLAAFTSVSCQAGVVRAGTNVTCEIVTASLSAETSLSITQLGGAGAIALLEGSGEHRYQVTFATAQAGFAGVRVSHQLFWSSATVEVHPAAAVGPVDVSCTPLRVHVGDTVRCAVVPRDRFGNPAEVEKPNSAPDDYFGVTAMGRADELAVHDTHVSFIARAAGRAGIVVILDGARTSSDVEVGD